MRPPSQLDRDKERSEHAKRGACDDVARSIHFTRRGLREDEKRWRFGLPGACEYW
jgi:hypothetical protein